MVCYSTWNRAWCWVAPGVSSADGAALRGGHAVRACGGKSWLCLSTQAAASLGQGAPELPVLGHLPGVCPAGPVRHGCVGRSSLVGEDTFPGPLRAGCEAPGVPSRSGLSVPTGASFPLQTVFTEGPAGQGSPTSEGLCLEAGSQRPGCGLLTCLCPWIWS